MKRRDFIKNTSLASTMFMVPSFVKAFDDALGAKLGYKRLVIVQLSGGNDGLNSLVPFRNDIYYNSRPDIGIKANRVLPITDDLGFHSSLAGLHRLYDKGYVSVINNVGYPNPDRSHFRSMDIWQSASSSSEYIQSGWIGRYLDSYGNKPYNAIEVDDVLSLALKGERQDGIAAKDPNLLFKTAQDPFLKAVIDHQPDQHLSEHNMGYLYKTLITAESSARYIYENSKSASSSQRYTNHDFGKQLRTMAQFINAGLKTKVFYTSHDGYDTHANQSNLQARLLKIYADNLEAFVNDLKAAGTFKDTLILTFSEFGRRVKQNAGKGTDHGAANVLFVIGENLKKPGLYNKFTGLNDLDNNGDLKFEIDFRAVYATVLNKWLEADDDRILNGSFKPLNFI